MAITCAMVFFLVATSSAFGWIMAYRAYPADCRRRLAAVTKDPVYVLMLVNVFILIIGFFMDMAASILILTPIFLPIAMGIGMDPVHFGIMLLLNLSVGLIHPPVGTALFRRLRYRQMHAGEHVQGGLVVHPGTDRRTAAGHLTYLRLP